VTTTEETTTRRRRARSAAATTAGTGRARRPRPSGDNLVAQLTGMVDQLIAENREIKRAIARAEKAQSAVGGLGQATKVLSGLQRRVSQALADVPAAGGRRRRGAADAAAAPRPRRQVTDPDVLERRRAALVKARAARAAKREAGV
jgi:hypothetical protein